MADAGAEGGVCGAGRTRSDPERDGVVRCRRKDLKRRIEEMFEVVLQQRTVDVQLAALGFVPLTPCPRHPKADTAAQRH